MPESPRKKPGSNTRYSNADGPRRKCPAARARSVTRSPRARAAATVDGRFEVTADREQHVASPEGSTAQVVAAAGQPPSRSGKRALDFRCDGRRPVPARRERVRQRHAWRPVTPRGQRRAARRAVIRGVRDGPVALARKILATDETKTAGSGLADRRRPRFLEQAIKGVGNSGRAVSKADEAPSVGGRPRRIRHRPPLAVRPGVRRRHRPRRGVPGPGRRG